MRVLRVVSSIFRGFLFLRLGGIFFAGHSLVWEQVKNLIVFDQVHSLSAQAHEMSAILAAVSALAGLNAKQVGIHAVDALAQRDTDFGNGDVAGSANRKEVFTGHIRFAFGQILIFFKESVESTSHENVRMGVVIGLDLLKTFIHPIDAVSTMNHIIV
jgi:hypothetical protein